MRAVFRKLIVSEKLSASPAARRIELQILMNTTAEAFDVTPLRILQKSPENALQAYAEFTAECMRKYGGNEERLFACAYRLGSRIRNITGVRDPEDIRRLVFLLYRNIGITMTGSIPGEIIVSGCYFSRIYTPEQCRLMSAMDSGVISGICGGGKLEFTERISEGCSVCRACFTERK